MVSLQRFFFFQAEDGIRGVAVTGVQTCALPIFVSRSTRTGSDAASRSSFSAVRDARMRSHPLEAKSFANSSPIPPDAPVMRTVRSEEHTSELQSRLHLVCRLLLAKKKDLITDII